MRWSNNLARLGYLQSLELGVFGEDIIRQLSYGVALQRPVLLQAEMSDGTRKQRFGKDTVCLNSHVALPAIFACSLQPHFVSYSLYKPGKKWHILSGLQVPPTTTTHPCMQTAAKPISRRESWPGEPVARPWTVGNWHWGTMDKPSLPFISIKRRPCLFISSSTPIDFHSSPMPSQLHTHTHIKGTSKCFCREIRSSYSQVTLGDTIGTAGRLTSTHSNSVFVHSQLSG